MAGRPPVFVHLLPGLIPPGALRGGTAVVVDVLRATTAMVHALAAGCQAIAPCAEIDDAKALASQLPHGTALLGGERGGLPIAGFDLGNSPEEYTPPACRGKTLVMTTTNGTRAILACGEASRVLIAAFVNLSAVARTLLAGGSAAGSAPIHIVCAGTEGFISEEDTLLAGALVAALALPGADPLAAWPAAGDERRLPHGPPGNDEQRIALQAWLGCRRTLDQLPLDRWLAAGRGGQNVRRIGRDADLLAAARINRFDLAPELDRTTGRITRPG